MNEVFLGIGSNIGDRFKNIKECLNRINLNKFIKHISSSNIYESYPMYNVNQRDFLNIVIKIETSLKPIELLKEMKKNESSMGRKLNGLTNQPRLIDIDILSYGDILIDSDDLVIPHPKITERAFVLKPWSDIDPYYKLPQINKNISELISELKINNKTIKLYNKNL